MVKMMCLVYVAMLVSMLMCGEYCSGEGMVHKFISQRLFFFIVLSLAFPDRYETKNDKSYLLKYPQTRHFILKF